MSQLNAFEELTSSTSVKIHVRRFYSNEGEWEPEYCLSNAEKIGRIGEIKRPSVLGGPLPCGCHALSRSPDTIYSLLNPACGMIHIDNLGGLEMPFLTCKTCSSLSRSTIAYCDFIRTRMHATRGIMIEAHIYVVWECTNPKCENVSKAQQKKFVKTGFV